MVYVQRKAPNERTETVDEFETREEAKEMLAEYRMSDRSANYTLSNRACKDWRES